MDLKVVGRHALLFDDDAMAAFVNSAAALVEWNSLPIDRYDVRHLLSSLPPSFKRRPHRSSTSPPLSNSDDPFEAELDQERYLDLPSSSDEQDLENGAESINAGGYRAVQFSYGIPSESTSQKNAEDAVDSSFHPPFPVPESLLQNLPPTEKVHQIIARTAMFVSKHGGQSEIILRVKQGDNPTFGFLMPDHYLHAYFQFLVDHQELLKSGNDGKSLEENTANSGTDQMGGIGVGGALSLLGSVYGSGEDEDGAIEDVPELKRNVPEETSDAANITTSHASEQMEASLHVARKDEVVSKNLPASLKEKAHVIKRNRSISTVKAGNTSAVKKEGDALGLLSTAADMSGGPAYRGPSGVEPPILEPPSDLKRVVDKIVEFILKNGKEFEAVLVQQDTKHGRFPFLLPSNQYHPYYLKVLQKAQEPRLPGKGSISEKHDSRGRGMDKKTASKGSDSRSIPSDIPYDADRKEKFKMVLSKSKRDGQDTPSKASQQQPGVSVDAAAAAAILQAATKGIKNPTLEILSRTSLNGIISQGPSSEGGQASSFGSLLSSQPQNSTQKLDQNGEPNVSVPVARAIAKTAAVAAASEADSSEASLTREQQLKAERLKRAKMFAAMIKSGAAPLKNESLRGLSVEPPESGVSGLGTEVVNLVGKEREGSSVPFDPDKSEKFENTQFADDLNERRSKRSYRSRSRRHEEDEEDKEEEGEDDKVEEKDHKHSRKKRRSHRSSHDSRDRHKHRKKHSSSKDKDSRHRNKHESSPDDEHRHSRHRNKHDSSPDDKHRHSQHRHKHDSASDDEHRHSRHRHKHGNSSDDEYRDSQHQQKHDTSSDDEQRHPHRWRNHDNSSDDEHWHQSKSVKHRKISHSKREVDLEEGEICSRSDQSKASEHEGVSREASVDIQKSYQDGRAPSQPSESTEVSDDLRAKIRAMLMATL